MLGPSAKRAVRKAYVVGDAEFYRSKEDDDSGYYGKDGTTSAAVRPLVLPIGVSNSSK